MLNGERLDVSCEGDTLGQHLMDAVLDHTAIPEHFYFGIAYMKGALVSEKAWDKNGFDPVTWCSGRTSVNKCLPHYKMGSCFPTKLRFNGRNAVIILISLTQNGLILLLCDIDSCLVFEYNKVPMATWRCSLVAEWLRVTFKKVRLLQRSWFKSWSLYIHKNVWCRIKKRWK